MRGIATRRGLTPDDLGDLFERPLSVVLSIAMPDGSILSRPVWHRFAGGRFTFQFPAGDRKIAMLERDPRVTALLAENDFPYRAIEVRGRMAMSRTDYHERAVEICQRYVDAYDPKADVADYVSRDAGVIVELDAITTTCWDYADDSMMPPTG
jgi:Pyridoxamine 5'-phosphate oxidase